jgi:hypothetical protein
MRIWTGFVWLVVGIFHVLKAIAYACRDNSDAKHKVKYSGVWSILAQNRHQETPP